MDIRLNIGCGGRPLAGYVNVDQDSLAALRQRYPDRVFPDETRIEAYDIFALPFADGSVAEVRCDCVLEHLAFTEEPRFLREVSRVLQPEGLFAFSVPDFEKMVQAWLAAADDWQDFYRDDAEAIRSNHWFGTYSYAMTNRWGYLMATIFGNQQGTGQFHKNAYTEGKLRAMLPRLRFRIESLERARWQGDRDHILVVQARKITE